MSDTQTPPFDEWAIVELLGHRRVAGRIREVHLAGHGFLRLDIPATQDHREQTQYIAPGSVYALHPTTEALATAAASRWRPEPVSRFELPTAPHLVTSPWDTSSPTTDPDDDDKREPPF